MSRDVEADEQIEELAEVILEARTDEPAVDYDRMIATAVFDAGWRRIEVDAAVERAAIVAAELTYGKGSWRNLLAHGQWRKQVRPLVLATLGLPDA